MENAIGIYNGEFAIRDKNKNYIIQDKKKYLPLIIERIDIILQESKKTCQISKIVFQSIKDVFNINKTFIPPKSDSIIPYNDELYIYLQNYVKKNPKFKEMVEQCSKRNIETKRNIEKFKKYNNSYYGYAKDAHESYISWFNKRGRKILF